MRRFSFTRSKSVAGDHIRDTSQMCEEIHVQPGATITR
jgi:hypothetical protein